MQTHNIGDIIRAIVRDEQEVYSDLCKVDAVDLEAGTADLTPLLGKAPILGARLIAGGTETPFLIEPKVDSVVVCTYLNKDEAVVSLYSEIENILLRGDQFGGLIKIEELTTNLDKLSARVDGIIDAINNGVPVPTDGGAGLQATIKASLSTITDAEDWTGLENENIKHG